MISSEFKIETPASLDMENLKLVSSMDRVLREKTQSFKFKDAPFDAIEFSKKLAEIMLKRNAKSIAANMVNVPYSIIAIAADPILVLFNPRIIDQTVECNRLEETSLLYPGLFIKIKRPITIKVRYEEPNGQTVTKTFGGLTSRMIQHEMDSLNGELFYNKATLYEKMRAFNKMGKLT